MTRTTAPLADDPLLARCRAALEAVRGGPASQAISLFVPGRVELLGKHTDYAGGRSVLLAIDRGFRMMAARRDDAIVRMIPADQSDSAGQFTLGQPADVPMGHWLRYPATTAERLAANFAQAVPLAGADIAFLSDLPPASGMSSSSAFMIATFLALAGLNRVQQSQPYRDNIASPEDLAMYLACVENGQSFGTLAGRAGVGTFGGSEDHTAILCCQPGRLSVFSFAPTVFEQTIDWPGDMALVVATCGVSAEKTGARREDFNRASRRARLVVERYNAARGTRHRHLRDLAVSAGAQGLLETLATLTRLEEADAELTGMRLAQRFEQFYREDQVIIPRAAEALRGGDLPEFGRLCDQSQAAAAVGLENQIPQTTALQRLAREHGALAASAFGAGFGGSVWAMAPAARAADFSARWLAGYRAEFPADAATAGTLIVRPGGGARTVV